MLIDWFTVGAQIINFLILIWLLKRFLYKPILDAVDARETLIASQLESAETTKSEAETEQKTLHKKNEEFEAHRKEMFSQAEQDADSERHKLLDAARKEVESTRSSHLESLKTEQTVLSREIARRARTEVFAISRKMLKDLASETLEASIVDQFVKQLKMLGEEQKGPLTSTKPAIIRSVFELPKPQQDLVVAALKANINQDIHVEFTTEPELISGIELTVNGNKVAWSIADYLASLERSIGSVLDVKVKQSEAGSKDAN